MNNYSNVDKAALQATMQDLGIKTPGRVWSLVNAGASQYEVDELVLRIVTEQKNEAANAIDLAKFVVGRHAGSASRAS